MASKVAAVDGRDVQRLQRVQRPGVIPVVEVAPVPSKPVHCTQGVCRAQNQLAGRDVAEVVAGHVRQQRQPNVGRRGAVRDRVDAVFLNIVGGQPVIVRADKGLEEGPGPPR